MAELTPISSCCTPAEQTTCCESSGKDAYACCSTAASGDRCGCDAGRRAAPDIRESVRERYATAALAGGAERGAACGCGPVSTRDAAGAQVFGGALYDAAETEGATATAIEASLGCGVPTAVADLHEGETVLDLGSGAGADVLISARRVGPAGRAIGLDMTDEMLELARANAREAGVENVEFLKGYLEAIPLPDASVDVVISNCVINLAADKRVVLAEAARVLRPGGRLAVSDVIADEGMDDATRADMQQWTGCVAGALNEAELRAELAAAGLVDVELRPTHRVHEHAGSAIIRARKPTEPALACSLGAGELHGRLELIDALARDALIDQRPIAGGLRMRFRDAPGVEGRVRELVAAESRCCAFLTFEIDRDALALRLDVTGPPDAQPVIQSFLPALPIGASQAASSSSAPGTT